ncbi:hypothetical protein SLS53_007839 [Cytospora paraplurivora]|uniref:Uncharacterized protein n=1 Tax=Cytospora paraplurivora TaxID=2898453 RepID=A0AAN9TZS6_9PEZI
MSSPSKDDLDVTPSTPQDITGSREESSAPREQPQVTPEPAEISSRTLLALTPGTETDEPSTPPTVIRTANPSDQQQEDSPDTGATVRPFPARNPQPSPTRAGPPRRSQSFNLKAPRAKSPGPQPRGARRRAVSTSQGPTAPTPGGAAAQPATPPRRRGFFPSIRDWFAPSSRADQQQQLGSSPAGSDALRTEGRETGQAAPPAADDGDVFLQPTSGATWPPRSGFDKPEPEPEPAEAEAEAEVKPEAQWDNDNQSNVGETAYPGRSSLEDLTEAAAAVHEREERESKGSSSPWANSLRGQDDFTFMELSQRNVRARAFERVFHKVQREGVFHDRMLFYRARYRARTREPNLDLDVLDRLRDQGTRALHQWVEEHARDITPKFQDGILEEVNRAFGVMRDRIGELLLAESTYVRGTADDLEELITRPPGLTRSNTSAAQSDTAFSLPDNEFEDLDRAELMVRPKKDIVESYLKRDAKRERYIDWLRNECDGCETRIASLEEYVRDLEAEKIDMQADVEKRTWNQATGVLEGVVGVHGVSRPTKSRTRRSKTTSTMSASSSRLLRSTAAASGLTPDPAGPGAASEDLSAPSSTPDDFIRQQLRDDLQDISKNLDLENALLAMYIRQIAEEADVALRPGLEEAATSHITAMLDIGSATTAQLHARLQQVTLERDRARRGEIEAREQLQSQAAPAQQSAPAPTSLLGRVSTALRGVRQPDTTAMTTSSTTAPPTISLNHPELVRLLRVVTQLGDELARCSSATSNLAQSMVRHGLMDTGHGSVLPALNNLREVVRRVRADKPETPTDNDLTAGNELWRELYLQDMEGYMLRVRQQVLGAINILDDRVHDLGRASMESSKPASERAPISLPTGYTQSQSSANWAVLGQELENLSQDSEVPNASASGHASERSVAWPMRHLHTGLNLPAVRGRTPERQNLWLYLRDRR